jgi:hypothetical protein
MKYSFLITAVILISCNSNQKHPKHQERKVESNMCSSYPYAIDSLNLRDLYDSAKWYIYTMYCDKIYCPNDDTLLQYYFGELDLKYSNLSVKSDTVIINYDFIDNKGQVILPSMMKNYKQLITGVGFSIRNKVKIFMESPSGFSVVMKGGEGNRYENPLQPEVVSYIKSNWSKLNECFKELAVQKGIAE